MSRDNLMGCCIAVLFGVLQAGCAIPLLNASAHGESEKVLSLFDNGHHANETFPLVGTTPLMLAAANGYEGTVKTLLDAGADPNQMDFTGWTALHAAAFKGDAKIVTLLLEYGAIKDRTCCWLFLESPLRIAERLDHKDVLPLLRSTP
jgi:ankyrin repeat protein